MSLKESIMIRMDTNLRGQLENLARLAETPPSSFGRGGLKFFCWLWENKAKNPLFISLWDEWTHLENSKLKDKLANGQE